VGQAALKYLAPYVFRVALSNNRIVSVVNDQVTFRYRDGATKKAKHCTLPAEQFIHRFLQHVLPKGFVKVRYFGLFSPGKRSLLARVRQLLAGTAATLPVAGTVEGAAPSSLQQPEPAIYRCPTCGTVMQLTEVILPRSRGPGGQAD
jgi:hypothetical protein